MSKKVAKNTSLCDCNGGAHLNACAPAATPALQSCKTQVVEVEVTRIVEGTPQTIIVTQAPPTPAMVELPDSIVVGILEPLTGRATRLWRRGQDRYRDCRQAYQ